MVNGVIMKNEWFIIQDKNEVCYGVKAVQPDPEDVFKKLAQKIERPYCIYFRGMELYTGTDIQEGASIIESQMAQCEAE